MRQLLMMSSAFLYLGVRVRFVSVMGFLRLVKFDKVDLTGLYYVLLLEMSSVFKGLRVKSKR
jgi:hypothetical protein